MMPGKFSAPSDQVLNMSGSLELVQTLEGSAT